MLAIPKPESRSVEKRKATQRHAAERAAARQAAYERDGGRCRSCGRRQPLHSPLPLAMECHEIRLRSLGGSNTDRGNVLCLCHECHKDVTEHRARVVCLSAKGADGLVEFARGETMRGTV